MNLFVERIVQRPFENTLEKIYYELLNEGFVITANIDLQKTFKNSLHEAIDKFVILTVCNPQYLYDTLCIEEKIGALLPCNIIIEEKKHGEVEVSILNMLELVKGFHSINLDSFAIRIRSALTRILKNL